MIMGLNFEVWKIWGYVDLNILVININLTTLIIYKNDPSINYFLFS